MCVFTCVCMCECVYVYVFVCVYVYQGESNRAKRTLRETNPGRNEPGRSESGRNESERNEPGRNESRAKRTAAHDHRYIPSRLARAPLLRRQARCRDLRGQAPFLADGVGPCVSRASQAARALGDATRRSSTNSTGKGLAARSQAARRSVRRAQGSSRSETTARRKRAGFPVAGVGDVASLRGSDGGA